MLIFNLNLLWLTLTYMNCCMDEWSAGYTAHVMTFEVGAVLEDAKWQAPLYCFSGGQGEEEKTSPVLESVPGGASHRHHGRFMRELSNASRGMPDVM
jgi:hypothetical protein